MLDRPMDKLFIVLRDNEVGYTHCGYFLSKQTAIDALKDALPALPVEDHNDDDKSVTVYVDAHEVGLETAYKTVYEVTFVLDTGSGDERLWKIESEIDYD
jgi:hypothetical protein